MRASITDQFDRLLDSLPRIDPSIGFPKRMPRSFFPMMRWPLSRPYLGFTPIDRRREHQIQVWLANGGLLPAPEGCSICKATDRLGYHAEDYYDLWRMCELCGSCHRLLHQRHRNPGGWLDLVDVHSRTGSEWFCLTPLDPLADFAGYLRSRFGRDHSLLSCSIWHLPAWVQAQVPTDGLMSLANPIDD